MPSITILIYTHIERHTHTQNDDISAERDEIDRQGMEEKRSVEREKDEAHGLIGSESLIKDSWLGKKNLSFNSYVHYSVCQYFK